MKAFILSLACSLLLSGPFLSELAAEPPHLPPPARELGRRPPDRGGDAGRAAQLRSSAAALGLSGLKLGGNPDFPSAIYGAGSGTIPGRTANEAARGFLTAFAPFYGLPHADLQTIETEQRPGFLPGYREVIAQRTVEGRPLYGARLRIHIGPGGEFLAALGDLYGELTWAGEPTLTGDEAAARATSVIDRIVKPEGIGPVRGATSPDAGITEAAYPLGARARPAFVVSGVVAANGIDLFEVVV
ncbi:MAG TPA: hypothetical protein VNA04_06205, partial [Thermoanaerobaculia bacterium]|nr:hypothetical protein [Thermoanaerobaculia bacterium]